jgi:3-hydroxybutyryl-CoA dehydrogenase
MVAPEARHAAIVGGGNMGADIAVLFAAAGWTTHVVEPSAATREKLPARFARALGQLGRAGIERLQVHSALEDAPWRSIDIAIECIPEKLEPKRALFADLERLARPEAILASNSSAFPISEIGRGLATQSRMAGLHFFLPAHLVPLVEVIRSEKTREGLPETLGELMRSIGKVPVQVRKDVPGFLANRLQHAMAREAYALIDAGVATPEDIDAAVRFGFGFRFLAAGPCLQRDHAGLEVHAAAAATMYPTLASNATVSPTLTDKVARGELGMKTGRGFYDWDAEAIAREKARYERALLAALAVLRDEE